MGDLVFPADFYVLDMEREGPKEVAPILLGRPFLRTARTKIDVSSGTLVMEVDGEVIHFDIFKAMKHPQDEATIHAMDVIDDLITDAQPMGADNVLAHTLQCSVYRKEDSLMMGEELVATLESLNISEPRCDSEIITLCSANKLFPSIEQAPKVELKPLPEQLKYMYLGEDETLPVIIKKNLREEQEAQLMELLRENKRAIGWTLADLSGISPDVCMHQLLLEDGAKPSREAQRRLNPIMMEVVQKEVLKLLDAGVIYRISDSKWVSPVHVVPKKRGITVEQNAEGELMPKRVQTGWRVCIDYRKLNGVTRKDHFPLSFMDQMLDRLAGKLHFFFLDGFSGYNQIPIAVKDQEKTTFTCPFGTFAFRRMSFGLCNAPGTFQ